MTGEVRDRRFVLPPADAEIVPPDFGAQASDTEASAFDLPQRHARAPKGHELVFRYDFGDDHRFNVVLAAIHPHTEPRAKYPRVVARTGKSPPEYGSWA